MRRGSNFWVKKLPFGVGLRMLSFLLQAKRAVQRGATAVIFDVSENPDAIDQVRSNARQEAM